jgi:hypothetical protein
VADLSIFLDEDAFAALLRISVRTAQRWRATGEGPPFIRAGARRVIYDRVAVEAWAKARTFPHLAAESARHLATNSAPPPRAA